MTPRGTATFSIRRPLGRVSPDRARPTGSAALATSSTAVFMSWMRPSVRASRSNSAWDKPAPFPASRSWALAARISSRRLQRAWAAWSKAASFKAPAVARTRAASLARAPISVMVIGIPPFSTEWLAIRQGVMPGTECPRSPPPSGGRGRAGRCRRGWPWRYPGL